MTTTINASPTNGLVQTADGSGVVKLQSNGVTTNALAWVNFNGTGTVAIRSSYNVSSITDNGTGDYTVNFATALADANYSFQATVSQATTGNNGFACSILASSAPSTTAVRFRVQQDNVGVTDSEYACVAVFGN